VFPEFDKSCATGEDCVLVVHTVDCCGNGVAWGINHTELDAFNEAEAVCDAQYPGCGCPSGPTLAEDGCYEDDGAIEVTCDAGTCRSFVGTGCEASTGA
jgi:hypothetical protein